MIDEHKSKAASERAPRPEQWNQRLSVGAKKRWKKISAEKKAACVAPLDAGRAMNQARYKAERREWDAIRLRLTGSSLKEIAEKLGFGKSRKRVRTAVRSVDLPGGGAKRYVCDRGEPFTRASGIELCKMLQQSYGEFARLISTPEHHVREKRIVIWFTNSQKNLDPTEVRACQSLRTKIATKLLGQDTRKLGFDAYSRPEVLAALFPRFREEYQLFRAIIPDLRNFFRSNGDAGESETAAFVIAMAQQEKQKRLERRTFRDLIRWLPELLPMLLAHRAEIAGETVANKIAVQLLAETVGAPSEIVRHSLDREELEATTPKRMRELLRIHLRQEFAVPKPKAKGGRPPKMSKERIREARALLAAIAELGGKRGAIQEAAEKVYPNIDTNAAGGRARKTLKDFREKFRYEN
jgi:hypothetical protein